MGTGAPLVQLLVAIPVVVGLVTAWSAQRDRQTPPIAFTWFVVPILVTIAISVVKPILVPRYLIVSLPAFALVTGLGVVRIGRRRSVPVVLLTLALIVVCYHRVWNDGSSGENWRAIVAAVGAHSQRHDAIVVYPATAVSAFSYYANQNPTLRHRGGPTWPPTHWDTPYTIAIKNVSVTQQRDFAPASVVWLVVRQPHGDTISQSVKAPRALAALRKQLGSRFSTVTVVRPWRTSDTVYLVGYSQPVQP
jgi:hypothetical protein